MTRWFPNLRRVDPLVYADHQAIERWRQAGRQADLHAPPVAGDYLVFRAEGPAGGWQGLVEAREWLTGLLPTLPALLRTPPSIERIVALFQALARPVETGLDELGYERLVSVAVSPARPCDRPLPRLATRGGMLWLLHLPESSRRPPAMSYSPWLRKLPHCLRATLGYSQVSPVVLSTLASGDLLRISRLTRQWQLADQPVGEFTLIEQGLHMTLASNALEIPPTEPGAELGNLPVQLEFVLYERRIGLAELAALVEGQVLELEPSVLGNIEIRANGRALARGELVQLGEGLGVELQQVRRECADEQ